MSCSAPVVRRRRLDVGPRHRSNRLGYEAALHYARKNPARLILASRSQAKGDAAIAAIQRTLPDFKGKIEFWSLDMSSFDSVRAFSDRLQELDRLDAIV